VHIIASKEESIYYKKPNPANRITLAATFRRITTTEPKEHPKGYFGSRDENGTDIFRPYSRPNPFREVLIRPYPSPDI
jgi:hypothetical protein